MVSLFDQSHFLNLPEFVSCFKLIKIQPTRKHIASLICSIPLNIIANGEKLIKETKINEIVPEAINILPNAINKSLKAIESLTLPGISPKKKGGSP